MDIIGNAIRNELGDAGFLEIRTLDKYEWCPEEERAAMRDEMKARIRINDAYRARSAIRARDIFSD